MSLIQQLFKQGIIDKEAVTDLEFEIKRSDRTEEELLLEKKLVPEDFLFELKSKILNIPLKKIILEDVPLSTLELIPEDTAKFYKMLALHKKENVKENVLEVGMIYPEDLKAQEALKFLARQAKFSYEVSLITLSDYKGLLRKYHSLKGEVKKALETLEAELRTETIKREVSPADFERLVEEAPITKVVAVILRHAVEGQASDIHIEPTKEKLRVRFRLMGILHSSIFLPIRTHPAIVARVKILANLRIDESRIPQDGRFTTNIEDREIDFRVSTFPTNLGEKVVIRVLDPLVGLRPFEELGLLGKNFEVTTKVIKRPYGLILATGPTGCGKTTTLYAVLRLLNKEAVNIVTLEDPIEYFIEGVNQSQMRPEIGYGFAQALRHSLRQDPDIIMVGEIRDEETASLAIHAALTGHIVLSTLHTSNVLGVIPRLIDLGVRPYLLTPTLSCAIAQRLVRKLCPECRKKVKPKEEIKKIILKEIAAMPKSGVKFASQLFTPLKAGMAADPSFYIYQAEGCKKCLQKGFVGQLGIFEVLTMTEQLADVILGEPTASKISLEFQRQEMLTMRQDGILKVLQGVTTIEEVLRQTEEK